MYKYHKCCENAKFSVCSLNKGEKNRTVLHFHNDMEICVFLIVLPLYRYKPYCKVHGNL